MPALLFDRHLESHDDFSGVDLHHASLVSLRGVLEAVEADREADRIRSPQLLRGRLNQASMESFEQLEHRPVLVVQQPARDVHSEVGRDSDEILVERAVVDTAEAEAIAHDRVTLFLEVSNDVRCVEELRFLQPADRTAFAIGRENSSAEPALVNPYSRLTENVLTCDGILDALDAVLVT